ncbi:hypothetical protein MNBD_PLANCTO03-2173 [hydrothermal vent metagenome]|uniref:Uncharacterized protein n=1 Tax=hydrothermal vent metagenome TaxID=652676 RepID=A0A3B1DL12_9ZZZZ
MGEGTKSVAGETPAPLDCKTPAPLGGGSSCITIFRTPMLSLRSVGSCLGGARCSRVAGLLVVACVALPVMGQSPFAVEVLHYRPGPGQFVQDGVFNDPSAALGAPVGGGTLDGDATKAVTLGGFGGVLVLRFDHTVRDDPRNPFGLDCIVFGNGFWAGGDANRRWGEPATIEIALDVNKNGVADDPWFLIPGSHLADPSAAWGSQTWDDDVSDTTYPPGEAWWVPPGEAGIWATFGYRLPFDPFESGMVLENPNGPSSEIEGIRGYADCSPTLILGDLDGDNVVDDNGISPEAFYTVPDDPWRVGIDPGSGGGDAFDIGWAIDAATGEPARLRGFDFIRLTNATNVVFGPFGERSAEVCGVADVSPRPVGGGNGGGVEVEGVRRP